MSCPNDPKKPGNLCLPNFIRFPATPEQEVTQRCAPDTGTFGCAYYPEGLNTFPSIAQYCPGTTLNALKYTLQAQGLNPNDPGVVANIGTCEGGPPLPGCTAPTHCHPNAAIKLGGLGNPIPLQCPEGSSCVSLERRNWRFGQYGCVPTADKDDTTYDTKEACVQANCPDDGQCLANFHCSRDKGCVLTQFPGKTLEACRKSCRFSCSVDAKTGKVGGCVSKEDIDGFETIEQCQSAKMCTGTLSGWDEQGADPPFTPNVAGIVFLVIILISLAVLLTWLVQWGIRRRKARAQAQ